VDCCVNSLPGTRGDRELQQPLHLLDRRQEKFLLGSGNRKRRGEFVIQSGQLLDTSRTGQSLCCLWDSWAKSRRMSLHGVRAS
jgi:hypothetical protein